LAEGLRKTTEPLSSNNACSGPHKHAALNLSVWYRTVWLIVAIITDDGAEENI
jgi:hypothetical protein